MVDKGFGRRLQALPIEVPERGGSPSGPALVGREAELAELHRLLVDPCVRLLTLTGTVGVGKSRLARETLSGSEFRTCLAGSVDLAEVTDRPSVAQAVLDALPAGPSGVDPNAFSGLAPFADAIGDGARILLLDNCDPVADEIAPDVARLLRRCPNSVIVVTSRAPLRLLGESVLLVRPLRVDGGAGAYYPASSPASKLLLDSIDSYYRGQQSVADRLVLDEIARELDGVPLALELAATEIARIGPVRTLRRIKAGADVQSPLFGDGPARHRTMHDAVDWSLADLNPDTFDLLLRLALFESAFEVELAYQVSDLGRGRTSAALTDLFERGLLEHVEDRDDVGACRVAATVRAYCRRVGDADPVRAERRRHEHTRRLFRAAESIGPRLERCDRHDGEVEVSGRQVRGLLAAVHHLIDLGQPERAIETVALLDSVWSQHGHVCELEAVLTKVLAERRVALPGISAALCLEFLGLWALRTERTHRAIDLLTQAGTAYHECGDKYRACRVAVPLAAALRTLGDIAAAKQELRIASRYASRMPERFASWLRVSRALAALPVPPRRDDTIWSGVRDRIRQCDVSIRLSALNTLARTQIGAETADRALELYHEVLKHDDLADNVLAAIIAIEGCARAYDAAGPKYIEPAATLTLAAGCLRAAHSIPQLDAEDGGPSPQRYRNVLGDTKFSATLGAVSRMRLADAVAYARSAPALSPTENSPLAALTTRQREIARLVATGMTNRMIASTLGISEWTVVGHVRQVMIKLECPSRLHVALVVGREARPEGLAAAELSMPGDG